MSFLGRYPLGGTAPLAFQSVDASGNPTLPDAPPGLVVYSDAGPVKRAAVPCLDRFRVSAFFFLPLFLDGDFAAGRYHAAFSYLLSGTPFRQEKEFEVMACGDAKGPTVGLYMMEMPTADYALTLTGAGGIGRLRNPRSL